MERPQAVRTRTGRRVAALGSLAGVLLLLAAAVAAPAQAAPGDLDLTFSGDGKQTTDFGFGSQQSGGDRAPAGRQDRRGRHRRHVTAGGRLRARPLQPQRLARHELLRRRQADDRLRGPDDGATGVALQGDGKIVVVGARQRLRSATSRSPATTPTARSTRASPATASRRPTSGAPTTARPGWRSRATARSSRSATRDRDGHCAGDFALARYNADGSLDTSFSGDGKQTTDFGGSDDAATGVALQGDGKIVAVGVAPATPTTSRSPATTPTARSTRASPATASRRPTSGAPTTGERGGAPGRRQDRRGRRRRRPATSRSPATTPTARSTRASPATASRRPTSGASDAANGVALQGDGKIVAVGDAGGFRATTSPSPATTRTARSTRASPATASRRPTSEAATTRRTGWRSRRRQDRRGRPRRRAPARDFALARYNPNGSLDTSFSGDGKQTTDFGGGDDGATGVALQADGKIVAVGGAGAADSVPATSRSPATTPNGSLDTSFSGDGKQTTDFGGLRRRRPGWRSRRTARSSWSATGGARRRLRARPLQPERLARHELLRRRQADDRLRGRRRGDRGGAPGRRQDRRGRRRRRTASDFALARYNPNGSLDTSFSGDGKQTTDFGGCDGASGVALQANGKIVAVGRAAAAPAATSRSPATTRTARSTRASPATASRRPTSGSSDEASGVALQGDGKIVAVGDAPARIGGIDFALARYNPNGSLDTSFSGDGKQTTDFGGPTTRRTGWRSRATARSSRSATAVGVGDYDFALARYNPNGSLDTSFSGDGKQTTDFGGFDAGERGGAPGRRQDRRGRGSACGPNLTRISRSLAIWGAEPPTG